MAIQSQTTAEVRYARQTAQGVIPTGVYTRVPRTDFDLTAKRATYEAKNIRSDRQREDIGLGTQTTDGNLTADFSVGGNDDFLAASIGSTAWTMGVISNGQFSISAANQSISRADGGSFIADGLRFGQTVLITGSTHAGNNVRATVVAVTAHAISVVTDGAIAGGASLVDDATEALTLSVVGKVVYNGAQDTYFTFETWFNNINQFRLQTDTVVDQVQIQIKPDSYTTAQFKLMGLAEHPMTGATASSSVVDLAYDPGNKLSSRQGFLVIGGQVAGLVTDLQFTFAGNYAVTKGIFLDAAIGMSAGILKANGQFSCVLTDPTITNHFNNEDVVSIVARQQTPNGLNFVSIALPNIKLTSANSALKGTELVQTQVQFEARLSYLDGFTVGFQSTSAL